MENLKQLVPNLINEINKVSNLINKINTQIEVNERLVAYIYIFSTFPVDEYGQDPLLLDLDIKTRDKILELKKEVLYLIKVLDLFIELEKINKEEK